jgi:predicted dinucleotide-binding enzyme
LRTAVNRSPERAALFYATDYPEAGRAVAKLITASGFSPVSVGGIDQSIRIEVGGDLHEFVSSESLFQLKKPRC